MCRCVPCHLPSLQSVWIVGERLVKEAGSDKTTNKYLACRHNIRPAYICRPYTHTHTSPNIYLLPRAPYEPRTTQVVQAKHQTSLPNATTSMCRIGKCHVPHIQRLSSAGQSAMNYADASKLLDNHFLHCVHECVIGSRTLS